MTEETEAPAETQETPITEEFDMDLGVAELADELGFGKADQSEPDPDTEETTKGPEVESTEEIKESTKEIKESTKEIVAEDDFHKSWGKEKADLWKTASPELQAQIKLRETQMLDGLDQYKADAIYGKTLKETITPYEHVIKASGLQTPQAINYLMNAHMKLTYGTPESIKSAYEALGRDIGVIKGTDSQGKELSPELLAMQNELNTVKQTISTQQQEQINIANEKSTVEVNAFADENPYFDEVSEDIALYVRNGLELKEAYDKAVWASPVTRLKVQAELQKEVESTAKIKADKEAKTAIKAKSNNVNSRHTDKAPTETKGKMFDEDEWDEAIARLN